eukprot:gene139-457_t
MAEENKEWWEEGWAIFLFIVIAVAAIAAVCVLIHMLRKKRKLCFVNRKSSASVVDQPIQRRNFDEKSKEEKIVAKAPVLFDSGFKSKSLKKIVDDKLEKKRVAKQERIDAIRKINNPNGSSFDDSDSEDEIRQGATIQNCDKNRKECVNCLAMNFEWAKICVDCFGKEFVVPEVRIDARTKIVTVRAEKNRAKEIVAEIKDEVCAQPRATFVPIVSGEVCESTPENTPENCIKVASGHLQFMLPPTPEGSPRPVEYATPTPTSVGREGSAESIESEMAGSVCETAIGPATADIV